MTSHEIHLPTDDAHPIYPDPPAAGTLRLVPLGGLGEFGKNAMALEYGRDMILVDSGFAFPEDEMLGVDIVIPDFSYITEQSDRLRGLVLTHGHEDHIGSVAFLVRQLEFGRLPVYGSRLTLALVRERLAEYDLLGSVDFHEVEDGERVHLGDFDIEFIQVSHSCPLSMALVLRLPIGMVLHTGDYRFEGDDDSFQRRLQEIAPLNQPSPFMLMMADSTNIDREGHSPNEEMVREGLGPVLEKASQTVILATFSSNLHRVQTVLNLAQQHGRKVTLCGYSLERNFAIAVRLGIVRVPPDLVVSLQDLMKLKPRQRLVLTTGTQGEPSSALARMALDTFRSLRIQPGDLIVLSSRIIPGNEKPIYRMIDHLYRRGARVITERDAMVHGSGHAYRGEMRRLFELVRPRWFIPLHGALRQLVHHRDLAYECGVEPGNVHVLLNGEQFELDGDDIVLRETQWSGQVLVDGKVLEGVEEVVLRDRQHLSEDGMLSAILVIDKQSRRIIGGPDIVSRGFVTVDDNEPLLNECRELIVKTFEACEGESREDWETVKMAVRKDLRKFLRDRTDRYPVILPVVVEI